MTAFDTAWAILKMPYVMPGGRVLSGEEGDTLYQGNKRGGQDTRYWTPDKSTALAYAAFGSGSGEQRKYRAGIPELRIATPTDETVRLIPDPEFMTGEPEMMNEIGIDADKTARRGNSYFYAPSLSQPPRVKYRTLPDREMLQILLRELADGQGRLAWGTQPAFSNPYTGELVEGTKQFDRNAMGGYDFGGFIEQQAHLYRLLLEMLEQGAGSL